MAFFDCLQNVVTFALHSGAKVLALLAGSLALPGSRAFDPIRGGPLPPRAPPPLLCEMNPLQERFFDRQAGAYTRPCLSFLKFWCPASYPLTAPDRGLIS